MLILMSMALFGLVLGLGLGLGFGLGWAGPGRAGLSWAYLGAWVPGCLGAWEPGCLAEESPP